MARVAIKLLLLLGVSFTASAQYDVTTEYALDLSSGSGAYEGDPTLVDNEPGAGDDYYAEDDYSYDYQFPFDPTAVDICRGYPEGE